MRALLQRCDGAEVTVAGEVVGGFEGPGLVALVGVTHGDDERGAVRLAEKILGLRIFEPRHAAAAPPGAAKELSAGELGLPVLVVSQFTLYADTRKGRRPTWDAAAPRTVAEPLVEAVASALRGLGARVSTGRFGADMQVRLVNDGPFTVLLET